MPCLKFVIFQAHIMHKKIICMYIQLHLCKYRNWKVLLSPNIGPFFNLQDAQEFSKLFLSLLEDTLSKQKNANLQNVIQQQFCGQFSYVTV